MAVVTCFTPHPVPHRIAMPPSRHPPNIPPPPSPHRYLSMFVETQILRLYFLTIGRKNHRFSPGIAKFVRWKVVETPCHESIATTSYQPPGMLFASVSKPTNPSAPVIRLV